MHACPHYRMHAPTGTPQNNKSAMPRQVTLMELLAALQHDDTTQQPGGQHAGGSAGQGQAAAEGTAARLSAAVCCR